MKSKSIKDSEKESIIAQQIVEGYLHKKFPSASIKTDIWRVSKSIAVWLTWEGHEYVRDFLISDILNGQLSFQEDFCYQRMDFSPLRVRGSDEQEAKLKRSHKYKISRFKNKMKGV